MTVLDIDHLGPSARDDVWHYVKTLSKSELEAIAFDQEWSRRTRRLRRSARMEGIDPNQLSLIDMHTNLPRTIRFINEDGKEDFKHRDMASLREIIANEQWGIEYHRMQVGVRERRLSKLHEFGEIHTDWDAPIGPYLYRDIRCAICGDGWREGDPFEKAHDVSVAAGGGDQITRLTHLSCNRAEGVG